MGPPLIFCDAPLLACTGVASLAGHALFTAAYGQAPASLQAPFNYFHIAWAVLLGWLVFRHAPESLALSGMALIAKSGERSNAISSPAQPHIFHRADDRRHGERRHGAEFHHRRRGSPDS